MFVGGIRRSIGVVLLGIVPFILFGASQAWAVGQQTTGEAESSFTANLNQERTTRGLEPLATTADLVALARQHSVDMASAGHPYHDPDIQSKVQNWQVMGDNVGSGPDEPHIHDGFMNSKIHRDEILYPRYTEVGVGCYWAGNVLYVTEIFRLPMTAAGTSATPAPRAAPATRVATRTVRPASAPAVPRATTAPTT
ncbi:MAG: Allergen V5/Tpx family protein, partial [Acidimicrobiales bacterium]|nr:Allergen V5/Tpx family protein [Acidimicrobiales bacterium]